MYQRVLVINACVTSTLINHIFNRKEKSKKEKRKRVRHCKLRILCVSVSDYLREYTTYPFYDIKENELKFNASTHTVLQL